MEGNVSVGGISRGLISSQGIIRPVANGLIKRKKSNKKIEMKQQPKPKMVKGEMGGLYSASKMAKSKNEFSKSLQGQKDYTAKYQKMTPAQKKVEDVKFAKAAEKLRAESKALNAKKK